MSKKIIFTATNYAPAADQMVFLNESVLVVIGNPGDEEEYTGGLFKCTVLLVDDTVDGITLFAIPEHNPAHLVICHWLVDSWYESDWVANTLFDLTGYKDSFATLLLEKGYNVSGDTVTVTEAMFTLEETILAAATKVQHVHTLAEIDAMDDADIANGAGVWAKSSKAAKVEDKKPSTVINEDVTTEQTTKAFTEQLLSQHEELLKQVKDADVKHAKTTAFVKKHARVNFCKAHWAKLSADINKGIEKINAENAEAQPSLKPDNLECENATAPFFNTLSITAIVTTLVGVGIAYVILKK